MTLKRWWLGCLFCYCLMVLQWRVYVLTPWIFLSFTSSQFPITRYWSLKIAKKIYAYGWKIFLCYSLIFAWETSSEKFQKYNCALREVDYIFEIFLWRLLSRSNIAFSIWSELRVISCLANTKAKTQGQLRICWYSVASRGLYAAWMQASGKLPG